MRFALYFTFDFSLLTVFMRILGIDPGTRITGYGLIDVSGNHLRHVDHGTIRTESGNDLALRLKTLHQGLDRIISRHRPDAVAVEQVFLAKNAMSALKLGHARGVALLAGVNADLPVFEYAALQVKSAVVGYGKADKNQVQRMVRTLLCLSAVPPQDAADALAVAICHAHSRKLNLEASCNGRG